MKKFPQGLLVQIGSNDAEPSCIIRASTPYLIFLRHEIELQPAAVRSRNNALGPQNHTIFFRTAQFLQNLLQLLCAVFVRRLHAPACENFIRVVMPLMPVVVMMVMIVTAAGTVLSMVLVMIMPAFPVMMMVVLMSALFVMVMMV